MHRPFKMPGNIKVAGRDIPLMSVLGLIATSAVWLVVVSVQPYSRWVGLAWMVVGLVVYVLYRRYRGLPLTKVVVRSNGGKPPIAETEKGI